MNANTLTALVTADANLARQINAAADVLAGVAADPVAAALARLKAEAEGAALRLHAARSEAVQAVALVLDALAGWSADLGADLATATPPAPALPAAAPEAQASAPEAPVPAPETPPEAPEAQEDAPAAEAQDEAHHGAQDAPGGDGAAELAGVGAAAAAGDPPPNGRHGGRVGKRRR